MGKEEGKRKEEGLKKGSRNGNDREVQRKNGGRGR
jgi:hypothetical protein